MQVIRFGIDLAKNVFQVHGVDATGRVVVQRQLRRAQVEKFFAAQPPALIGMVHFVELVEHREPRCRPTTKGTTDSAEP